MEWNEYVTQIYLSLENDFNGYVSSFMQLKKQIHNAPKVNINWK